MKRVIPVVVALLLFAGGCGGDGDAQQESGAGGDHNQADVNFAQMMIPHHEQAVEMSGMVAKQASAQPVKELARRIERAQGPEIERMKRLLSDWGESTSGSEMHMGHGMEMGMMSEAQMKELSNASGRSFDRMFLQMMIEHHEGAVGMAEEELRDGKSGEAKNLAQQIKTTQEKEIEEMKALLRELT